MQEIAHMRKDLLNVIGTCIGAYVMLIGFPIGLLLTVYLLFASSYWWLMLFYLGWIFFIGKPLICAHCYFGYFLCAIGGYVRDYLDMSLVWTGRTSLNPHRNYMFCGFPHGYISVGAVICFACNVLRFNEIFKHHEPIMATLKLALSVPFQREVFYGLRLVDVSAASLTSILSNPAGGKAVCVMPGGSEEVFHGNAREYKFFIKNRKGFVKLALKNGTPLVPFISFGENQTYDYLQNKYILAVSRFLKNLTGVAFVVALGRWYTLIPKKVKITVVGK